MNSMTLINFHEDLNLGERYFVDIERVSATEYRIVDVSRPERFTEKVVGMKLMVGPNGVLIPQRGPRNSVIAYLNSTDCTLLITQ